MSAADKDIWKSRRALAIAATCLNLLSLTGVGVTAVFVIDQRNYNNCQRAYNDAVTRAIDERAKAGDLDRQAIQLIAQSGVDMVQVILPPAPGEPERTPEEQIMAIQNWQAAQTRAYHQLKEADQQRMANPLPGPKQC